MTKVAALITGASRGLGREFAVALARQLDADNKLDLDLYLWARSAEALAETKRAAEVAWAERKVKQTELGDLETKTAAVDLGEEHDYVAKTDAWLEQLEKDPPARLYIFHNAASLGVVGPITEWKSPSFLRETYELNIGSVLWINKRVLDLFGAGDKTKLTLVNITSLSALEPIKTFGLYCMTKAARDMHHRVLALEYPHVRVLNFAPGPTDTVMNQTIRDSPLTDSGMKDQLVSMKASSTLIPPEEGARVAVEFLLGDQYESGAHVEHFDVVKGEQIKTA